MRLATAYLDGRPRALRVEQDDAIVLPFRDVGEVLQREGWRDDVPRLSGRRRALSTLRLAPPVLAPEKIVCVGLNYRSHAEETGHEVPAHPPLFAKYARALVGPFDDIALPAISERVDWEAELGVVIGRPARFVDEADALDFVAGYTVINDVSMRDWQRRTSQFLQGKTFEATTPVGPAVVTLDELENPDALQLTCHVDGVVMQNASTAEMVFSVQQIVSYVSQIITLVPGDLIATGTPAGIGSRRKPQTFLREGQTLTTAVAGIGELRNAIVGGDARSA